MVQLPILIGLVLSVCPNDNVPHVVYELDDSFSSLIVLHVICWSVTVFKVNPIGSSFHMCREVIPHLVVEYNWLIPFREYSHQWCHCGVSAYVMVPRDCGSKWARKYWVEVLRLLRTRDCVTVNMQLWHVIMGAKVMCSHLSEPVTWSCNLLW